MASKYTALSSEVSLLTTELNSLGSGSFCSASSAIDNDTATTHRDPLCIMELTLATQGSARSSGATIDVYFLPTEDGGTTYSDSTDGCIQNNYITSFSLDAATTARTIVKHDVLLPPSDFKVVAKNSTGVALASSGNTIVMKRYGTEDV